MKSTTRNMLIGFALAVGVLALLAAVPSQTDFDGTYFKTNTLPISLTGNLVNWQQRATNSFSSHWVDSGTTDATLAGTASVGSITLSTNLTIPATIANKAPFYLGYGVTTFSGTPDPRIAFGYNTDFEGVRSTLTQPQLFFGMEADYNNGSARYMEFYLNYTSADGLTTKRLFHTGVDTNTSAVYASLAGQLTLDNVYVGDPVNGSSLHDLITLSSTNASGPALKFANVGAANPYRTIRQINGSLQFVNSAYDAVVQRFENNGNVTATGTVSGSGFLIGATVGITQTNSWQDGGTTNWTMIIQGGLVTSLTHSP